MVMSNTYYLNHYLFLNKHLLFLFKAVVQDQYITTKKSYVKQTFFFQNWESLGRATFSVSSQIRIMCKQIIYLFKMSYYTVSYTQIIFSKITILEYSNISMTYHTHIKVGVCQDTLLIYSNCFNSRQNGKHRRSRSREGRIGNV